MNVFEHVGMPSLAGATGWLNSEPLGRPELGGHVVLVDFWTLTCINWLRTEPYVREWSRAYADDGLIVIGVHTPEFAFEHDIDLVGHAIADRAITYPVVVDNDYEVWNAFGNRYWPAQYLLDEEGVVRDTHVGEGRYEESERVIQRLLGVERELSEVVGEGVEAEADWEHLGSPETYLGADRGGRPSSPGRVAFDEPQVYERPERLRLNHWALDGIWTVAPERIVLNEPGGTIAYRFHARDVHLVLRNVTADPIPFRVLLDGAAPRASRGVDTDEAGHGVLHEGRMYQLIRQADRIDDGTVEIAFGAAGAAAYSFTFG